MYWKTEIPVIVRALTNDYSDPPTYNDCRIVEAAIVAAQYVIVDLSLQDYYKIDIINKVITPDPSDQDNRDGDFVALVGLKTACIIDQSTFRTKSALEGIRTSLGSANLSVSGSLSGYKVMLDQGPCKTYSDLVAFWDIENAGYVRAVLSPFVGNKFYPNNLPYNDGRNNDRNRNFFT